MTRKALGRGLNALFTSTATVEQGDVLMEVEIDLLEIVDRHPAHREPLGSGDRGDPRLELARVRDVDAVLAGQVLG